MGAVHKWCLIICRSFHHFSIFCFFKSFHIHIYNFWSPWLFFPFPPPHTLTSSPSPHLRNFNSRFFQSKMHWKAGFHGLQWHNIITVRTISNQVGNPFGSLWSMKFNQLIITNLPTGYYEYYWYSTFITTLEFSRKL